MKRSRKAIALSIIAVSTLSFFFYSYFALGKFIKVLSYINSLEPTARASATNRLRNHTDTNIKSGIFSQKVAIGGNINGIWLINMNSLKYYKIDQSTIFSSLSLCKDDKWKSKQHNLSKNANINYKDWVAGVKQGDYMQIILNPDNKIVTEVISYDWWAFINQIPVNFFSERCKNDK